MAPSAALATAPPREAPNVSRDRPLVHETRARRIQRNRCLSEAATRRTEHAESRRAAMAPSGETAQAPKAEASATARRPRRQAPRRPSPRQRIRPPRQPPFLRSPPKRRRRRAIDQAKAVDVARPPASHPAATAVLGADAGAVAPAAVGTRSWRSREDRSATGRSGDGGEGPFERSACAARSGESRNAYARKDRRTRRARDPPDGAGEGLAGQGPDPLDRRGGKVRRSHAPRCARRSQSRRRERGERRVARVRRRRRRRKGRRTVPRLKSGRA